MRPYRIFQGLAQLIGQTGMGFATKQIGNLRPSCHLILRLFLLAFLSPLVSACTPSRSEVVLHSREGDPVRVQVEVATTPEQRRYGLMYRKDMPEYHGMLFLFPKEVQRSFWMKNTVLSLDIVYINATLTIVHISANTTPFSEAPIPSGQPAQFVLEVNSGFCERHGIASGDQVEFIRVPTLPLR